MITIKAPVVLGVYNRVRSHSLDQVVHRLVTILRYSLLLNHMLYHIFSIRVWTMKNVFVNINTSLIQVRRPNYPFNCYTLDLADQKGVKNVGVKQLFINLWPKKNSSLKILLEDKSLACNRTIKYHKFFFSGKNVKIVDLGKIDNQTV